MISGPSAIVTIFTAVILGTYADDLAEAFTIVMLAGLLQIAFGVLRLGRFVANLNGDALGVALITLAVFIVWPPKLHQVVPNALAALIAGNPGGRAVVRRRAPHR